MHSAIPGKWRFAICLVATLATISVLRLAAQAPGATVTAVDAKTGVVTAKVNSTGQVFTFTLANKALLNGVHAGQGVYVNLGNKQVSLDGKQPAGTITSATAPQEGRSAVAPAITGGGTGQNQRQANTPAPCCEITGIDTARGVVTAKVQNSAQTFQFQVKDATLLKSLKVGQGTYANFNTRQVSTDGILSCCTIMALAPAVSSVPSSASSNTGTPSGTGGGFQLCCTITSVTQILGQPAPWAPGTPNIGGPGNYPKSQGPVYGAVNDAGKWGFYFYALPTWPANKPFPAPKVGQSLYVDFGLREASFDGVTPCCGVTTGSPPLMYKETVFLDVLPVAVLYVPPGDPHATGKVVPQQTYSASGVSAMVTTTMKTTINGQTKTFGVSIPGISGMYSPNNQTTSTSNQTQTSVQRNQGLMVSATGPGGYPGQNDQILFYVNPTFDVTYAGAYSYGSSVIPLTHPQTTLVVPHCQPNPAACLNEAGVPQWLSCTATIQALQLGLSTCLDHFPAAVPPAPVPYDPGTLAAGQEEAGSCGKLSVTLGVPGKSNSSPPQLTAAQRLIQFDPMVASADPASVTQDPCRFQPFSPYGQQYFDWSYCAPGVGASAYGFSQSTTLGKSTTNTTIKKFTTSKTLSLDPIALATAVVGVVAPGGGGVSGGGAGGSGNGGKGGGGGGGGVKVTLNIGTTVETDYQVSYQYSNSTTIGSTGSFGGGNIACPGGISSIASDRSGSVTVTTTAAHGMQPSYVGTQVLIQDVANNVYNGEFTVTSVPSSTTFTVQNASAAGAASATGGGWTAADYETQLYYDALFDTVVFWTQQLPDNVTALDAVVPVGSPAGSHLLFTGSNGRRVSVSGNATGHFHLRLPPGNYTYQLVDSASRPRSLVQRVTVPAKGSGTLRLPALEVSVAR